MDMTAPQIIAITLVCWLAASMASTPAVAHHDVCIARIFVDAAGFTDKRQVCGDWTADWRLVKLTRGN